jgi:hypothetical protein
MGLGLRGIAAGVGGKHMDKKPQGGPLDSLGLL